MILGSNLFVNDGLGNRKIVRNRYLDLVDRDFIELFLELAGKRIARFVDILFDAQ